MTLLELSLHFHWQYSSQERYTKILTTLIMNAVVYWCLGANLPGLVPRPSRPSFCRLQYEKREEAWTELSRDACRCDVTYCKLATIDPVAIVLAGQTEQKEWTEFRERRVKGREHVSRLNVTSQHHTSRDKSIQACAFPRFRTASNKSWAWRPGKEASLFTFSGF